MYNCLIVDDEPLARELIRNYCHHLPFLKVIKCSDNAIDAKLLLQKQQIDILFLDINMPVLDGIAFLKTITKPPLIIFTTAYKEYALDAFDLSACDYLLKPFSLERFLIAVDKAIGRIPGKQAGLNNTFEKGEDFIFIKSNGKIIRVLHDDFLFAEAQGNYIKIVSSNNTLFTNMTFAGFEALLPGHIFIRVHRSFIVNKSKITHIEGDTVFIAKVEIPVGESYKKSLMRSLGL